jgi:recombination protein RecR
MPSGLNDITRGVPDALGRLMAELTRLPGIGPRSAERIAFHLLRTPPEEAVLLADAIRDVKRNLRHCSACFNLTEDDPCPICRDPQRDRSLIVVVEQPRDVMLLEQTGLIRGVYHVLMGHIAPLEGVEPADLTIDALLERVRAGGVREVLLATNPTMEGDGTALYIHAALQPLGVAVSRLARGLAVGSEVEYASRAMLEAAITGRTPM